jgi:hypothetical protein
MATLQNNFRVNYESIPYITYSKISEDKLDTCGIIHERQIYGIIICRKRDSV